MPDTPEGLTGPTHRTVFRMPSLGSDMESGKVVEWQKEPGAFLARGDILLVVEADKGELDVEVFDACVLEEVLAPPGTELKVGSPLAFLRVAGEAPDETLEPPAAPPSPGPPPTAEPAGDTAGASPPSPGAPRPTVRASPRARRRADELGLDLAAVVGTGPGGAVSVEDVEEAAGAARASPATPMRSAIAAAMSRANREIPHYYLTTTVDLEPALTWLERFNADRSVEDRVLPAALLLAATARAATAVPELNGFWRDGGFEAARAVHLGVAVSLKGGGLVVPALRDAEQLSLAEVMAGLQDLVARARGGRLKASEVGVATFTVTNLGDLGVDGVFPVIHPPQVAMVGLGRTVSRPWVVEGAVVPRRLCTVSLAADHRATDGRVGARFLVEVDRILQEPGALAQASVPSRR